MKRHLVMMLCLIAMAASMNAQSISGKLVNEKNEPLAYANVVLLSMPDSTFVSGTISDEMGAFRLTKDEKGQLVRISSIGYATIYKKVESGIERSTTLAYANGSFFSSTNLPLMFCAFIDAAIPIRQSIITRCLFIILSFYLLFLILQR